MKMSTNTFRAFVKHLNKHNQIEVKVKMYSLRQMHLLHKSWESHQFWIKSLWHQAQQLLVLYLRICFLIYVEEKSYLPKTDLPWGQFSSSTFLCSATMGISTRSVVKPVFQETNTIFHVVKMDNFSWCVGQEWYRIPHFAECADQTLPRKQFSLHCWFHHSMAELFIFTRH